LNVEEEIRLIKTVLKWHLVRHKKSYLEQIENGYSEFQTDFNMVRKQIKKLDNCSFPNCGGLTCGTCDKKDHPKDYICPKCNKDKNVCEAQLAEKEPSEDKCDNCIRTGETYVCDCGKIFNIVKDTPADAEDSYYEDAPNNSIMIKPKKKEPLNKTKGIIREIVDNDTPADAEEDLYNQKYRGIINWEVVVKDKVNKARKELLDEVILDLGAVTNVAPFDLKNLTKKWKQRREQL
jgi:hypothetical protein